MKKILVCVLLFIVIAVTFFSCVGYQVSYGTGFGVASGPYGYGGHPSVNVGVYGGGYPRIGY